MDKTNISTLTGSDVKTNTTVVSSDSSTSSPDKNIIDIFVDGLRKGLSLATNHLLPNVVMAFTLIHFLTVLNVLTYLGIIFEPLMSLFSLPGDAVTVLLTTWFSAVAGVGIAAALYTEGVLTATHLAILLPGIFLMGGQLQYMGRILAVIGIETKHYIPLFIISIINAFLGMLTMRFIL